MTLKKTEFMFFGAVMLFIALYWLFQIPAMIKEVSYDCRIAEISPDVPMKVRKACRELQLVKQGDKHE